MYKLRELERKDLETINSWRNNPELISFLGAPFRYINKEVDDKWFDSYMNSRNNTVRCSIVDENNTLLGLVSLTSIDMLNQSASLHIMIGDSQLYNKGIGTFATKAMLKHAFNNLNLNRIELLVLKTNERAQHMYEKVGFVKEGVKRQAVYKKGRFVDMYLYSALRSDNTNLCD